MYKVYGSVTSRAFRVLWALEELGATYTLIKAGPQSDEIRELNPLGKIPVLVEGDEVLHDSVAIMTYLADKHGGLTAPAGTTARAVQDAATLWVIDELDAQLWTMAKHGFILPEDQRVPEIRPALRSDLMRKIDMLGQRLTGEFLVGEQFTIADILCVHCLNWAIGAKVPMENDAVNAYAKNLRARPAFLRVRALNQE